MRANRPANTKPELLVRSMLHRLGYRYRVNMSSLPGRPDIVFSARKRAIFIHGCFWHAHGCSRSRTPRTRQDYWLPKLEATQVRDARNTKALEGLGWQTLTLWECQLDDASALLHDIESFLGPPRFGEPTAQ